MNTKHAYAGSVLEEERIGQTSLALAIFGLLIPWLGLIGLIVGIVAIGKPGDHNASCRTKGYWAIGLGIAGLFLKVAIAAAVA